MSDTVLAFTFPEMIAAQEVEVAKWEQWFLKQPASLLDLPLDLAKGKELRSILFHVVFVELYFGQSLNDLRKWDGPREDLLQLPHETFADLFDIHHRGLALLKQWAEHATPEDADKILVRGELRISKKKGFI